MAGRPPTALKENGLLPIAASFCAARLSPTVNAICPWHVATEMLYEAMKTRGALFGKTAEEYTAQIVAENPQKRLTTVEEIAALALFLASPEARSINGQALNQCGGAVTAS